MTSANKSLLDKAIEGADYVVHTAAALPLYSPEDIYTTDVEGTRNVLDAALRHGVKRFVHVSSTAVYGIPDHHPLYETDRLEGVGPYGQAKIQAEMICLEYRARGLTVPIIRPKSFVGPERLGVFALLYDWAYTGHNFPMIGSGDNRYQLLDVEDLCDAISLCLTLPEDRVNDTFNIGAKEFTTMKEDYQSRPRLRRARQEGRRLPRGARDLGPQGPRQTSSLAALQVGVRDRLQGLLRLHREGREGAWLRAEVTRTRRRS